MVMTAKIIGHNVEVITLVNGLKWLEVLARIPAVSLHRNTAIKILARVRNMTYYNIISNFDKNMRVKNFYHTFDNHIVFRRSI